MTSTAYLRGNNLLIWYLQLLTQDPSTGYVYYGSQSQPRVSRSLWGPTSPEDANWNVVPPGATAGTGTAAGSHWVAAGAVHAGTRFLIAGLAVTSGSTPGLVAAYAIDAPVMSVVASVALNAGESAPKLVLSSGSASDPYVYVMLTTGVFVKFVAANLTRVGSLDTSGSLQVATPVCSAGVIDATGTYAYLAQSDNSAHIKVKLADMTIAATGAFGTNRKKAVAAVMDPFRASVMYTLANVNGAAISVVWVATANLAEGAVLTIPEMSDGMPAQATIAADGTSYVFGKCITPQGSNTLPCLATINVNTQTAVGFWAGFSLKGTTIYGVTAVAADATAGTIMFAASLYPSTTLYLLALQVTGMRWVPVDTADPNRNNDPPTNTVSPPNFDAAGFKQYFRTSGLSVVRTTQTNSRKVSVSGKYVSTTGSNSWGFCALSSQGVVCSDTSQGVNTFTMAKISTGATMALASTGTYVPYPSNSRTLSWVLSDLTNGRVYMMFDEPNWQGGTDGAAFVGINAASFAVTGTLQYPNDAPFNTYDPNNWYMSGSEYYSFACGVLDASGTYGYFGTRAFMGHSPRIVKISLSGVTVAGTLMLSAVDAGAATGGGGGISACAFDSSRNLAFFATDTNYAVYTLSTSSFTWTTTGAPQLADAQWAFMQNPFWYVYNKFILNPMYGTVFAINTTVPAVPTISWSRDVLLPSGFQGSVLTVVPDLVGSTPGYFATSYVAGNAVGYPHMVSTWIPATLCADGSATPVGGGVPGTSCTTCPSGTFASGGAESCTQCPPGQLTSDAGAGWCWSCDQGFYTAVAGSSSCAPCPAGTQANAYYGSKSCSPCPAGKFGTAFPATFNSCGNCPAGSFAPAAGSTSCALCPAGTYSAAGASACTACSNTQYSPSAGATACTACPTGTYGGVTRATSCTQCPLGTWSTGNVAACTSCNAGQTTTALGSSSCSQCPAGSYCPGAVAAIPCPVNTFTNAGNAGPCAPCAGSQVAPPGSSACAAPVSTCPVGKYLDGVWGFCLPCPSNAFCLGGTANYTVCVAGFIPAGWDLDPAVGTCTQCGSSSFCTGGSSRAAACPVGTWTGGVLGATDASFCSVCTTAGFVFDPLLATCGPCPAGTYYDAATVTCPNCAAGYTSAGGGGPASCSTPCPAGYGGVNCTACPVGTYARTAGAKCVPLPVNTYTNAVAATTAPPCSVFSVSPGGGAPCVPCPGALFSALTTATCVTCTPGYFLTTPSTCGACPANTYATSGSAPCQACPSGSTSTAGSATCTCSASCSVNCWA